MYTYKISLSLSIYIYMYMYTHSFIRGAAPTGLAEAGLGWPSRLAGPAGILS